MLAGMDEDYAEPRPQRFDPIFATWTSPDGLLPDPARRHGVLDGPVSLVGAVPPELAETDTVAGHPSGLSWAQRARWYLLVVVSAWVAAIVGAVEVSRTVTSGGAHEVTWWAWLVIAVCVSLAGLGVQRLRTGRS
jgi:hypothetical protein